MVRVVGLLVAAIALYFQFKNNNKQIIQKIPQQPISNNNPYDSYNNFFLIICNIIYIHVTRNA